jgi:hypothetical protein
MVNAVQEKDNETKAVSPLANDPTFGEKVYNLVFNVGINFVVNLLASAGFSYWVAHSTTKRKFPGLDTPERPAAAQTKLENTIGQHILRIPSDRIEAEHAEGTFRSKAAKSMAGVATLTFAGHFIMIPSVWLGAKIKAPLVKWLNERHYGKDALEDPSLKARQDALEIEERPTLFGAIVGRAGTIVATQTTAWAIGHDKNFVKLGAQKAGFKWGDKFNGLDAVNESIGDMVGGAVAQKFDVRNAKLNESMRAKGYGWSPSQEKTLLENGHTAETLPAYGTRVSADINGKTQQIGGGFLEHFGRYVSADILYTAVTSLSIGPAINFLKHYIPGMTYTPKAALKLDAEALRTATQLPVKPHPIRDEQEDKATDKPSMRINTSEIKHLDRVAQAPELEMTLG